MRGEVASIYVDGYFAEEFHILGGETVALVQRELRALLVVLHGRRGSFDVFE